MGNSKITKKVLGVIVLGQTPRNDVKTLFESNIPHIDVVIKGALDGISYHKIKDLINNDDKYPLWVKLSKGKTCEISLFKLIPYIEKTAEDLCSMGADLIFLMCTGNFPDIISSTPIIYPNRLIFAVAQIFCTSRKIGIILPNEGQARSAVEHWQSNGFIVETAVASPRNKNSIKCAVQNLNDKDIDLIVMDCMGFDKGDWTTAKNVSFYRIICPQKFVVKLVAEIINIT
jgi:protein AroM